MMNSKFACFLKYQYYNKKKKPWRKSRKKRLVKYLFIMMILEAVILLPHYGSRIRLVSQEADTAENFIYETGGSRKAGETREQGLSIDWKEGTLKLWQKVERAEKKMD